MANLLADDGPDGDLARGRVRTEGEISAPDLVDIETVSVLRKRWLAGDLSERRFATAIEDLESIELDRYSGLALMRRAFELRANLTPYDAAYIALAEGLGCPLVTADRRLAGAPGVECEVDVLDR